VRLLRYIADK
jgi:hypothetical protein